MFKYMVWILPVVLIIFSGCSGGTNVQLGEKFTLSIGESASISGEDLEVYFKEVVGDSRCPQGVTCIWAGEATSVIKITHSGTSYEKVLTQPGLTEPPQDEFQDYIIVFDLKPYPQENVQTGEEDYRLQLEIRKKAG